MTRTAFSRQDALRRGMTPQQLAGPLHQRLFYDLYVHGRTPVGLADRARAVLRICPEGSFVSHHTAASIWRARPPETAEIHVSVPSGTRSRRRGVRSHRARGVPTHRQGLPISTPVECFLELASVGVGLIDLVAVGDALVAAGHTSPVELVAACGVDHRAGARLARRAAALVRDGVDSSTETRLRLLVVLAGLPEPAVRHIIRAANGDVLFRFDLCFPAVKLLIEYDGRPHAESSEQWDRGIRRREAIERMGWRVVVITADALYNRPSDTLDRIWTILAELGADLPARRHAAWAQNFTR